MCVASYRVSIVMVGLRSLCIIHTTRYHEFHMGRKIVHDNQSGTSLYLPPLFMFTR